MPAWGEARVCAKAMPLARIIRERTSDGNFAGERVA
jgi:hypothetical protein